MTKARVSDAYRVYIIIIIIVPVGGLCEISRNYIAHRLTATFGREGIKPTKNVEFLVYLAQTQ